MKRRDRPIFIMRLPRDAGFALDITFQGERVTVSWSRWGVPSLLPHPPTECSLDEFTRAFLKEYPAARERLADVLPDGV